MEDQIRKSTKHKEWIYWTGICREDRTTGLNSIKDCIDSYGFITDHHLFSDISIGLRIEIEEQKINSLYNALNTIIGLSEFKNELNNSTDERTIMLNVTFTKSTGNFRIEIPAVPG